MANKEHLAKLTESLVRWNEWRQQSRKAEFDVADFSPIFLRGRFPNLPWTVYSHVDLTGARLGQKLLASADLCGADLVGAHLEDADLCGAFFIGANLAGANLAGADLTGADLRYANLDGSTLVEARLQGAVIGRTIFNNHDLSKVKGLDSMNHAGPSVVGIDALYRSQGKIPLAFLRGAGVPENLITYMQSLVAPGAIQFYSCFISYSTKDQEFADRLYADLQNRGVRCWFAPHDIQGGKKIHEQIDEAIRLHERLLLILSPNSMNSKWVETEIRNARNRELAETIRVLFPVRLTPWDEIKRWKLFNADEGRDLATEIREYYIPDFSEWKSHDPYQREFEKLLRDLRTDASTVRTP
jgi:uncharacterized protein YjbI with pentapeptide repeats